MSRQPRLRIFSKCGAQVWSRAEFTSRNLLLLLQPVDLLHWRWHNLPGRTGLTGGSDRLTGQVWWSRPERQGANQSWIGLEILSKADLCPPHSGWKACWYGTHITPLSSYIGCGAFELNDAQGGVKCYPCCDDSPLSLVAALGGEDGPPWCVGDLILFLTVDRL
jgi:hypothetical protein